MLIDDIKIKISAGHGGKGSVAFNTNLMSLGPVGGAGGKGGSVYAMGVSDLSTLNQFRFKKQIQAENGRDGRGQFKDGYDGENLTLKLPVGTVIHNLTNNAESEITKIGEELLLAQGGKGGKGNFHFRSSTNTSPKQFQPGLPGEEFEFRLELKLIADVGFVGLPNVGKSSLLNALTNAKSKVANYPFTTLEPNLGVYYELILADIPGLIEGSSSGKGLGIKFLRHIERTKIIFHFISAESVNPLRDYKIIKKELSKYNTALADKPEYVFLSKSDIAPPAEIKKKLATLSVIGARLPDGQGSAVRLSSLSKSSGGKKLSARPKTKALAFSIYDDESLKAIQEILNKIKADKFKKV